MGTRPLELVERPRNSRIKDVKWSETISDKDRGCLKFTLGALWRWPGEVEGGAAGGTGETAEAAAVGTVGMVGNRGLLQRKGRGG